MIYKIKFVGYFNILISFHQKTKRRCLMFLLMKTKKIIHYNVRNSNSYPITNIKSKSY